MVWAAIQILLSAAPAYAADACSALRLDELPTSLRSVPVYDQRGIDNCYAFAVAQAVDAFRFSHGDQNRFHLTAPTHLSVMYAYEEKLLPLEVAKDFEYDPTAEARRSRVNMNIGSPSATFSLVRKHGSCDSRGFIAHRDQLVVEAIWLSLTRLTATAEQENRGLNNEEIECFKEGLNYLPNAGKVIHAFKNAMTKRYPISIMKEATDRICKYKKVKLRSLPNTVSSTQPWETPEERKRRIHAALDQIPAQPPVVSYCARVLSDREASSTTQKPAGGGAPCSDRAAGYDGHVSLVVGRRRGENGKCQLLVRNSWGFGCTDRVNKRPYAWDCSGGQIWVDDDVFAKNTYWVSYLPSHPMP